MKFITKILNTVVINYIIIMITFANLDNVEGLNATLNYENDTISPKLTSIPANISHIFNLNDTKIISVLEKIDESIKDNNISSVINDTKIISVLEKIDESIKDTNNEMQDHLISIVVGSLIAASGLFIGNMAYDHFKRPQLKLDKNSFSQIVDIDIELYYINERIPLNLRLFTIPYKVNRIIVTNDGRRAAKNCVGTLSIKNREEKICWSTPSEKTRLTINAHSNENLDVCGILNGDRTEIYNKYLKNLEDLKEFVKQGLVGDYVTITSINQQISDIQNKCASVDDIPMLIIPTENGWQNPPKSNRILLKSQEKFSQEAYIIVSSENSRNVKAKLTIKYENSTTQEQYIFFND